MPEPLNPCCSWGGEQAPWLRPRHRMSAATRKLKYGGLATLPLPEPKHNTHGAVGVNPHELLQFLLPTPAKVIFKCFLHK